MNEERIKLTLKDLKDMKSWSLSDIASVLFAEVDHRETKLGSYVDVHGTLLARSIYELDGEPEAYKFFAREIKRWVELSLVYHASARIDASVKPYLRAFLSYYKRLSETAA